MAAGSARKRWRALLAVCAISLLAAVGVALVRLRPLPLPPDRAAPRARFPLRVSADRRHLEDQDAVPFLIRGEAAWSLVAQPTREEVELYLEDRRRRGFNLLLVNLIERFYAADAPRNAYGEPPFTKPGDFATPNPAYFAHADWVLRRAAAKGFAVLLCPAYLGYEGGEEGWYQEELAAGPDVLREYGRFVGARYRAFDNIVWLQGGDFTPPAEHLTLVDAVAEGIKARDERHLHGAHFAPETSAADVPVHGWLDFNTTYTYRPTYEKALADHARVPRRPTFLVETRYEDELDATPQLVRAQAYYAVLSGAAGEIFGNHWIWQFKPPRPWRRLLRRSWITALDSPGTRGAQHLHALLGSVAWTQLVPDVQHEVLVGGQGARGSMQYAALARSADRRLAILYVPTVREVELDLGALTHPLRARWYDPASGAFSSVGEPALEPPRRVRFRPPGSNAAGDGDWVLLLESGAPP